MPGQRLGAPTRWLCRRIKPSEGFERFRSSQGARSRRRHLTRCQQSHAPSPWPIPVPAPASPGRDPAHGAWISAWELSSGWARCGRRDHLWKLSGGQEAVAESAELGGFSPPSHPVNVAQPLPGRMLCVSAQTRRQLQLPLGPQTPEQSSRSLQGSRREPLPFP